MTDPAIEAARRAMDAANGVWAANAWSKRAVAEVAAREALKPIRAVVEEWRESMPEAMWEELAVLIYPESELK